MTNIKRKIFIAGATLFVIAGFILTWYYSRRLAEEREFERLAELSRRTPVPTAQITEVPEETPPMEAAVTAEPTPEATPVPTAVPTPTVPPILEQYQVYVEQNPDFWGWISIDDTVIDYPVMWRSDDNTFYLKHNFYGEKSSSGTPFIDCRCSMYPQSDNLLIYAHRMKNGTMFKALMQYEKESFYTEHKYVRFDTRYETGEYLIIAAYRSQIYPDSAEGVFRFYNFVGSKNEAEFNDYITNIKAISNYETGETAVWGDELITLITCAYHVEDGRFVVVAKKIK